MNRVRCAIYTRKSSEEGLEQDFNSLHAQREACGAYILSQASEGWQEVAGQYDDGGLSGGTLERPALQRLLTDIRGGLIDIVVVYKVDRLTRSLLDFAKLVEAFDAVGTSFVSVTQSFNTTTSMGRLTLNMLLSFAQFEREVTAERIRDKIAASKARGMWMGGTPPLGYRPDGRSLAIVAEQAAIIRGIYARYLELGTVKSLTEDLRSRGLGVPRLQYGTGRSRGGGVFTRGQLYHILKNATYAGFIVHRDRVHPGLHPPIIDKDTWDRTQALLADHVQGTRTRRESSMSMLAGKLTGPRGEVLIAAHASKTKPGGGTVRYRYYVSRDAHHGTGEENQASTNATRIPAREIEALVTGMVAALFSDPLELIARFHLDIDPSRIAATMRTCEELAPALRNSRKRNAAALVRQVRVYERDVRIEIDSAAVATLLSVPLAEGAPTSIARSEDVRLTRTGTVLRLVDAAGCVANGRDADDNVLQLLAQARRWWRELAQGQITIDQMSKRDAINPSRLTRVLRLAFLSPAVVKALLDGTVRASTTASTLVRTGAITMSWEDQAQHYLVQ